MHCFVFGEISGRHRRTISALHLVFPDLELFVHWFVGLQIAKGLPGSLFPVHTAMLLENQLVALFRSSIRIVISISFAFAEYEDESLVLGIYHVCDCSNHCATDYNAC